MINKMELGLRELIAQSPSEEFRGVYVEGVLNARRGNVPAPASIGVYSGGSIYNAAQVTRDETVKASTDRIDKVLRDIKNQTHAELSVERLRALVELTVPDQAELMHYAAEWLTGTVDGCVARRCRVTC